MCDVEDDDRSVVQQRGLLAHTQWGSDTKHGEEATATARSRTRNYGFGCKQQEMEHAGVGNSH